MTSSGKNGLNIRTNASPKWVGCWLVVLRINVDLAIFQPYLDLEAGDNQSLKIQVARPGIEPGPLAPQAKSLTTRPPLLQVPNGTGPGVRRSKRPLLASRTRCNVLWKPPKFGNKVKIDNKMQFGNKFANWCNDLSIEGVILRSCPRMSCNIWERETS